MKILMVNKFLYPRGGAETYVLKLGSYLQEQGHVVQYFGMHDERNVVGNSLNMETHHVDFVSPGLERYLYPFRILYSREAKEKIQAIAMDFRPDIVHLNNINFQLTPSVIDGISELGIPMVQTVHDFQMICPNHLLLNINKGVPCELCVEGSKWNCLRHRCIHSSLAKSILGSIEGILYQRWSHYSRIHQFICPSYFIESMLQKDQRFLGKTVVLHNFVDLPEKPIETEKKDYVLYFGRLAKEKDLEGFLEACGLCPDIPFVIAGSGPLEYLLTDLPSNVKYVGFQSGNALRQLIAQAQFSVCFSTWYENCPLAVLESQSLGTPVLANRIGGIPELITEGKTGILIDSFTPENYALQIRCLYQDVLGLAEMSENCKKQENRITLPVYTEHLLDIYRRTLMNND